MRTKNSPVQDRAVTSRQSFLFRENAVAEAIFSSKYELFGGYNVIRLRGVLGNVLLRIQFLQFVENTCGFVPIIGGFGALQTHLVFID